DEPLGVITGIGQLAEAQDLDMQTFCARLDALVHGTTTTDNTMIEMDDAATGLLVTRGHRDEIEMRRVHKEEIWDPSYPAPPPIARRRARIPIPERCAYDGEVILPLDDAAVRGVMPPDYVAKRAVTLLGSGPTGGVMGAAVAAQAAAAPDFVAVDMGGTSFDICLVRGGRPVIRTDRNWRYRYYIGIPMVDVRSVGAGGGSIARVR